MAKDNKNKKKKVVTQTKNTGSKMIANKKSCKDKKKKLVTQTKQTESKIIANIKSSRDKKNEDKVTQSEPVKKRKRDENKKNKEKESLIEYEVKNLLDDKTFNSVQKYKLSGKVTKNKRWNQYQLLENINQKWLKSTKEQMSKKQKVKTMKIKILKLHHHLQRVTFAKRYIILEHHIKCKKTTGILLNKVNLEI